MWRWWATKASKAGLVCGQRRLCWHSLCCCFIGSEDRLTLCVFVYVWKERGRRILNNVVLVLNWVFPFGCSNRLETTQAGSAQWTSKHTPEFPQRGQHELHTDRTRENSPLQKKTPSTAVQSCTHVHLLTKNAERDKWASAWPEYWRNFVEEDWSAKVNWRRCYGGSGCENNPLTNNDYEKKY